ncbi:hypothetical protein C7475_107238 [Chitinophaga sp. S165]|nr:hypothetical protein C7475_107238 [Chitinophaga sp. S165]
MIITAIFLLYGYLCRFAGLYFFWESKSIGWVLFFVTLIFFLLDRIKKEEARKGKAIGEKIGIGVQVIVIITKCVIFIAVPYSDTYAKAEEYIRANHAIQSETGAIKDIFFVPYGNMSEQHTADGFASRADMHFVVKGADKYLDLNLLMGKDVDTDWEIIVNE